MNTYKNYNMRVKEAENKSVLFITTVLLPIQKN